MAICSGCPSISGLVKVLILRRICRQKRVISAVAAVRFQLSKKTEFGQNLRPLQQAEEWMETGDVPVACAGSKERGDRPFKTNADLPGCLNFERTRPAYSEKAR